MKGLLTFALGVGVALVVVLSYKLGALDQKPAPTKQDLEPRVPSVQPESKQSESQRLILQRQQLQEVDVEFAKRRQDIEDYYADCFAELGARVDIDLRKLDATERGAYAEFTQRLNNTVSKTRGVATANGYVWPNGYVSTGGAYVAKREIEVQGNPAADYRSEVARINEAVNRLMDRHEMDFYHLRRRKACMYT